MANVAESKVQAMLKEGIKCVTVIFSEFFLSRKAIGTRILYKKPTTGTLYYWLTVLVIIDFVQLTLSIVFLKFNIYLYRFIVIKI